jgi:ComF family protein
MHWWKSFLEKMLDSILPRAVSVSKFDTISVQNLASCAHSALFHAKVGCYAPLRYASPLVQSCVHAGKYYAHERATHLMGEVLAPYVADLVAEQLLFGLFEKPLIIPIPLHAKRARERGFNQSERIARTVAELVSDTPLTCRADVLMRTRDTHAQARLTKERRLQNMVDAFSVTKPEALQDADVILIDDVVTTGATIKSAREALERAGARTVLCVAVAH